MHPYINITMNIKIYKIYYSCFQKEKTNAKSKFTLERILKKLFYKLIFTETSEFENEV